MKVEGQQITKCRIMYLVGQLRAGGLERQLFYLLSTLDRKRYRPAVLVWRYKDSDRYVGPIRSLGVSVWSFSPHISIGGKLRCLRQTVRETNPEVLHSYSFYTNFAAQWAAYRTSTIAIGSIRSDFVTDKSDSGPYLGRLSARWPATQICNSRQAATAARSAGWPFVPRTLHVVRNGIDLMQFQSSRIPDREPPVLIGIGSLVPVKRWDQLIAVAAKLKEGGHTFRVRIVGEGPLMDTLQQYAKDLHIEDQVMLTGQVENIADELRNATILVHTSEVEGCPNVVMEAMASGRPVVAMDSGDIGALVEHGRTGFVVSQGREQDLALYIGRILSDPQLRRRMGEAGRDKAVREFGLDRLLAETLSAYRTAGWKDE